MIQDALVAFIPIGSPLSLVGAAGVVIPSPTIVDLLGTGVGTAPQNIIGARTLFGADMGIGDERPEINMAVGVACAGGAGQLLKIALQGAADQGAAGNYQPSTWTDIASQDGITMANLVAGAIPARFPFLPTFPANLQPRYLRLLFSPMTATALPSGNLTAGTIAFAIVTRNRDDQANKFMPKNFSVA